MSEDIFKEYGGQKSLQEILEDLALYCQSVTTDKAIFNVMLPQKVVDHFNYEFEAKERPGGLSGGRIKKMYLGASGVCRIYDTEDYAVVKVEK